MTEAATILHQEIARKGAVSFARFMELALYCPNSGYYERHRHRVGRQGDFYTSVSPGALFGEILAFQFARWLEGDSGGPVQLVEAGAHDGQLACDVLNWLRQHRPDLMARLEYWLIEPSLNRQGWQQEKLEQFAGRVHWAKSFAALPPGGVRGIVFSNELLDALPVHRLAWDRTSEKWMEWGVCLSPADQFAWGRLPENDRDWAVELRQAGFELTTELQAVLPDGFTVEFCPAAADWWRHAAAVLRQGRLLTIDYGCSAQELLSPERSQGTLRAYRGHRLIAEVLATPGEVDLTAHVNFTQLQRVGEAAGLKTEGLFTQTRFLTDIAKAMWSRDDAAPAPNRVRQFQTLTHPEHLGRSFRVLVQLRGG